MDSGILFPPLPIKIISEEKDDYVCPIFHFYESCDNVFGKGCKLLSDWKTSILDFVFVILTPTFESFETTFFNRSFSFATVYTLS
ncbi:hypothetical protein BSG1_19914 [Bacillus sp. SG-1]|nr:hypothetical protein BSG1_19914 [Bacillus sp. SG-1]